MITAESLAALYGKGIFTTIAVYARRPFLWDKHWRRLKTNAAKLDIDLSDFPESSTRRSLDEMIRSNNIENGRARITFFDESPSPTWPFEGRAKINLQIISAGFRQIQEKFHLTVSPFAVNSNSPLTGLKTCNYLENLMALEAAKAGGFDEAIRLNERGDVTSAAMANVFWLKDGVLHTPSLKTGCLAGTTREFVLENLECREVETALDEIYNADAIFLTSAGIGVVEIAKLDDRDFVPLFHPIVGLIGKAQDEG